MFDLTKVSNFRTFSSSLWGNGGRTKTVLAPGRTKPPPQVSLSLSSCLICGLYLLGFFALVEVSIPQEIHKLLQEFPYGFVEENYLGASNINLTDSFGVLLLEIAIVVLVSKLLRLLLKPLKQPRIVSDILGGVFVGPSVLCRYTKFSDYVFPEDVQFVLHHLAIMGFMYFLFITGVKMDLGLVRKSSQKQLFIATIGCLVPALLVALAYIPWSDEPDENLGHRVAKIGHVSTSLGVTAFSVLYPVLQELNLLSSEVGRLALSTAIVGDCIGIGALLIIEGVLQLSGQHKATIQYIISVVVIFGIMYISVPRVARWIINKTPEGKPVHRNYVAGLLLGALAAGFVTDMFGVTIGHGSLWFGLLIPDGPPLGSTLVDRSESLITEILMPFSFAMVGLHVDVSLISRDWDKMKPLAVIIFLGCTSKLVAVMLAALHFQIPLEDSLTLSLIMSLRGQVEVFMYLRFIEKKVVTLTGYSMFVVFSTTMTAIVTPFITVVYDPTRPYMTNTRRTIQHTPPRKSVCLLACIHDEETVTEIINLLEVSNPTPIRPFIVTALHLVELKGRAAPVFIDHDVFKEDSSSSIHHAMKLYETETAHLIRMRSYTAISPRKSMYQDICKLAVTSKAAILILPFHKECNGAKRSIRDVARQGMGMLNMDVLTHAPCSVGILVNKAPQHNTSLPFTINNSFKKKELNIGLLFLGGADAREALSYASFMSGNPDASITVLRFLSHENKGEDETERKLDEEVLRHFMERTHLKRQVKYEEVIVKDGAETVKTINAMQTESFDLWIVGRKNGINPMIICGLSAWSENQELGVIGDHLASDDFGSKASVLVIQQQVLRIHTKKMTSFRNGPTRKRFF